jgi:hypothetical protein
MSKEKKYTARQVIKLLKDYDNYLLSSIGRDGYYNGIDFVKEFIKENNLKRTGEHQV